MDNKMGYYYLENNWMTRHFPITTIIVPGFISSKKYRLGLQLDFRDDLRLKLGLVTMLGPGLK